MVLEVLIHKNFGVETVCTAVYVNLNNCCFLLTDECLSGRHNGITPFLEVYYN